MRSSPPPLSRQTTLLAILLSFMLLALVAVAVLFFTGAVLPGAAPAATAVIAAQRITIDSPAPGATVGSPFELRGRAALFPSGGTLTYRIVDSTGAQIGTGTIGPSGAPGQPAAFAAFAALSTPASGAARVEVIDPGAPNAVAAVDVVLAGTATGAPTTAPIQPTADLAQPTAAPIPATATIAPQETAVPAQQIVFDTPPAGVEVGSPVTITGRTTRFPSQGRLSFRVLDGANRQLGVGVFPVSGAPGQPATFVASIAFSLPPAGGPIRIELFDQNAENGVVVATAALGLEVTVPQQIVFDTPPPGTQVGSPVTITGRTARPPFQGNLAFTITGPGGARLATGIVPVTDNRFVASLSFSLPAGGGAISAEFVDQNAANGAVAARAAIDLSVSAPTQAIAFTSPAPGTLVGSPMTVTGRTVLFPSEGDLAWRVRDARNVVLGSGTFVVVGQPNQPAQFTAGLSFTLPAPGGPVTLDVLDQTAGGSVIAIASLPLNVAPQTTPTVLQATTVPTAAVPTAAVPTAAVPTLPPSATAPVNPSAGQVITIETPSAEVLVGSPMTLTGRTVVAPRGAVLNYRIATASNQQLGEGQFAMLPSEPTRFNVSLTFALPQQGGPITVVIFERDSGGAVRATTTLRLNVAPQAYPAPQVGP